MALANALCVRVALCFMEVYAAMTLLLPKKFATVTLYEPATGDSIRLDRVRTS